MHLLPANQLPQERRDHVLEERRHSLNECRGKGSWMILILVLLGRDLVHVGSFFAPRCLFLGSTRTESEPPGEYPSVPRANHDVQKPFRQLPVRGERSNFVALWIPNQE